MNWVIANWDSVLGIITGLITVASIVAKLTPSETDDKMIAKVLKVIDVIAINSTPVK